MLAHEMLHAALRHGDRVGGRDPYLWNVAADYVINGWLVEMGVGELPEGLLYDPSLAGLSAEEVYDLIATDLRRLRKLATLRGRGLGDVLGEPLAAPAPAAASTSTSTTGAPCATGPRLPRVERPRPAAGRAGRGDPGAGPAAAAVGRAAGPLVRRVRPRARSRAAPTRAPPAGRRPPRTSRARAGSGRRRRSRGAPSASCWTPPGRWTAAAGQGARRDRLLRHRPRRAPAARVVFCDAAAYDAGYLAGRGHRRAGQGARARRHGAAAGHQPAGAGRRLPAPTRRSWSSPTATATWSGSAASTPSWCRRAPGCRSPPGPVFRMTRP